MNIYLTYKAIHLIAVISWMAGLLYLPRIFVYHTENQLDKNISNYDRIVHTAIFFADGCTRGDDKFHFSVDRSNIKVGEKIDSDVTPIAFPITTLPERPKNGISDDFIGYKMFGLLPKE